MKADNILKDQVDLCGRRLQAETTYELCEILVVSRERKALPLWLSFDKKLSKRLEID